MENIEDIEELALEDSNNINNEDMYIGIVEHNDNEGESFGYYVLNTQENREYLEELKDALTLIGEYGYYGGEYSVELEGFTGHELDMIDYGANNNYMDRVNIIYLIPLFT